MIRRALVLVLTLGTATLVACGSGAAPPTPTPTIVDVLTPVPTTRPTLTPLPTRTPAPFATPRPTATPTPSALHPVVPVADILPGTVEALHSTPDGALWLVSDRSVARRVDDAWSIYLADFTGNVAGIDVAGRVWVLGEDRSAIAAWDGSAWTDYGAEEGWTPISLEGGRSTSMDWGKSDGSGNFWLATPQDVRVFDGEGWTVFTPQEMGMGEVGHEELWATFTLEVAESTGTVWVGECDWGAIGPFGGQGVRRFDGQTWHGAGSPVGSGCATAIEEDGAGRVWMGVDDRLWRYDPASDRWTELAPPEPPVDALRFGFVHGIGLDGSDEPWPAMVLCGASCYGKIVPYHVHEGQWVQMTEALEYYGLPYRLVTGPAGRLWLFSEGNVYRRVTEDVLERVTGLYVQHITLDVNGQAWFVASHEGQDMLWTIEE